MNDDTYCLFIIFACMITLAVPSAGQVIVAVFAFALAALAQFSARHDQADRIDHCARYDITGR